MRDLFENKCRDCKHYLQHYIKRGNKFEMTHCADCGCKEKDNEHSPVIFAVDCRHFEKKI